ncbi:MAG: ABC transporter permease [Chloroflexi bacterium]|nr:ABC transporter permease [Chloroflexota bacterium]
MIASAPARTHSPLRRALAWAARPSPWLLLAPCLALLGLFFVIPLAWLVRLSLYERPVGGGFYRGGTFTAQHYESILTEPYFRSVALATLELGAIVTIVSLVIGYPVAVFLTRGTPALRAAAFLAVLLPKLTNPLVAVYGVLVLLANAGPINVLLLSTGLIREPVPMFANLFAVVVGETLIIAPYPILIIASALHGVDPVLETAARGLGAGPARAFYEISFKLTLPSVLLATLVTLVWSLGAFTAPVVLGNPELYPVAVDIFTHTFEDVNWPLGAALTVVYSLPVLGLVAATYGLQRQLEQAFGRD